MQNDCLSQSHSIFQLCIKGYNAVPVSVGGEGSSQTARLKEHTSLLEIPLKEHRDAGTEYQNSLLEWEATLRELLGETRAQLEAARAAIWQTEGVEGQPRHSGSLQSLRHD